jgi:uncharacterized protein (DUF1778 family)
MHYIAKRRKKGTMKALEGSRAVRIEARIAPDVLAVVRRAAEIQGHSISDFIVAAAQDAALKAVAEVGALRFSREAQGTFVSLLLNPRPPSAGLKRALKRHRSLIAL